MTLISVILLSTLIKLARGDSDKIFVCMWVGIPNNFVIDDKYMFVYYYSVWDNLQSYFCIKTDWLIIFITYFVLCNVTLQIISNTLTPLTE